MYEAHLILDIERERERERVGGEILQFSNDASRVPLLCWVRFPKLSLPSFM